MKKIYLLAITSLIILTSCDKDRITGGGSTVTEHRSFKNFTGVHVSGSTNVIVNQSPNFSVQVRGYENLLPYFESSVQGGTLKLGYKNNISVNNDNVQVIVNLPVLTMLAVDGSSDIQATGNFTASGGLNTIVSGSGNIFIEQGIVDFFYTSISGSGNVHAFGVLSRNTEVHTSGSGNAEVSCTNELYVRISGSGNVYYKGNPVVNSTISGSGKVIKR